MADEVDLAGVPETLLWTLYHRAVEARRPDAVLHDPLAVELVDRLDYPFEDRFGDGGLGQWQALRARTFDREVRRFLAAHPDGTVVALGEGLETQFWRVDNGRLTWLTVDLPEAVELRERLLPGSPRRRAVAVSAFDPTWMEEVDASRGVLVTAQGLLMYFERDEVGLLIGTIARRLPAAGLVFDAVPAWLSARSRRGELATGDGYRPPPWPWGLTREDEQRFAAMLGDLGAVRLPRGRGVLHGYVLPLLTRVPPLRRLALTVLSSPSGSAGAPPARPRPSATGR